MQRLRIILGALALACLSAPAAAMVTINVTTNKDEANCNTTAVNPPACHVTAGMNPLSTGCSLREALQNIDAGNNTSFPECTPAPETGPNAVNVINLAGAGGTITINGLVPDPSDPTHTNMIHAGTMPDVFSKTSIGTVTVTGGDITCAASPDGENIFTASDGSDLTLTGITVHDCNAFGVGLVVRSQGSNDLKVTGSNFLNIKATSTGPGAVISHHGGNLTIGSSSFTSCTQDNGSGQGQGGAVGVTGVSFPNFVTIDSTNFLNNTAADVGGALYLSAVDSITVSNDIFTANTAGGDSGNNAEAGGGAIWALNTGKGGSGGIGNATNFFLIFNSQFISNSASNGTGGAIVLSGGDLSLGAFDFSQPKIPGGIVASNFTGNSAKGPAPTGIDLRSGSGGAIYAAGNLSVLQSSFVSTIGANSSAHSNGGAIAFYDAGAALNPLLVVNTTFNGNTADQDGGAIANLLATTNNAGKIQLLNDTFDNNPGSGTGATGGAFYNGNTTAAQVTASNTIFANTVGAGGNCAGQPFTDMATNLQFPGLTCGAAMAVGNPNLANPGIFAGPNVFVFTQSLNAGSAASNQGTNSVCNGVPVFTFDGTGRPGIRPSPGGSKCDIGAYESGNAPVYASNPPPGSTINISALTTMPMTATVVISNTGSDNLTVTNYSTTGNPQITVVGPPGTPPFTIPVGNSTQTLTLTCQNAVPGNFNGTLTVTHNAAGTPATYTVNCDVTAPLTPLSITTVSPLPNASVGSMYSQTFAATGGTPPYGSWVVTTPATFPAWATLDPNTGMMTGTPPNTAGSPFTFTIQVSDNGTPVMMATKQFTLTVIAPPLSITTASPLPNATTAVMYNQSLAASGGVPPYNSWTVTTPATFPAWASLNAATGAITGTPPNTTGSPFTFTVQVADSNVPATTTTKQFTLTVAPPPLSITTASPLPNATVGSLYMQMFAATGGTPPYTNWAITAGTPPAWANLTAGTGAYSGTPPNTAGSPFTFTVTVTDSALVTASKMFALQVNVPPLTITTPTALPGATVSAMYSTTLQAGGGIAPYSNWTVTTPATFPVWATLNPATGAITGTPPSNAGSPFTFTVQVQDSNTPATTTTKQFTLQVGATPVTLQEFGVD